MTFSPIDNWTPRLDHERDLFFNVYIDETSQTKFRYLIIGGLVVPLSHALLFENEIIAARAGTITPAVEDDGTMRVMKWQKLGSHNFDVYKKVIDTTFNFRRAHKLPTNKDVAVHCVGVDTSIKSLRQTGDGDIGVGFNIEFYFLCATILRERYRDRLFALYPDRREEARPLSEAKDILNRGSKKYGDLREYPFRRLLFADPERCQALQVVDIIIGGIAYKLNGHYDKPDANTAKREFCDYLYDLLKIKDLFYQSQLYRNDFFTFMLRPKPPRRPKSWLVGKPGYWA
jgi:hypothetical protein